MGQVKVSLVACAVLLSAVSLGCSTVVPRRCPYARETGLPCSTCRVRAELEAQGEMVALPSLRRPPRPELVRQWSGAALPQEPPAPSLYIRCRPCDCGADGTIAPWSEWDEINRRAYARLRTARAPYPVAIVPGYHAGDVIPRYRVALGLRLLQNGWVAAMLVSGGHRRGGASEARGMLQIARELAARDGFDVTDRILVEPCACHSTTNLRNSLRMMAAMRLPRGLLVTDSKVSGQAQIFSTDLDGLVARDLRCPVGRVSHLIGTTSLQRLPGQDSGCRATLGFRHNPVLFGLPRREPVMYWVSPFTPLGGATRSALDCGAGSPRLRACEPDDEDPWTASCQPRVDNGSFRCGGGS